MSNCQKEENPNNFYSTSPTNFILSSLASEFLQRIQILDFFNIFFFFFGGGGGGGGGERGEGAYWSQKDGGGGGQVKGGAKCKITNMSYHRIHVHSIHFLLQSTFPQKMIISE